MQTKNFVVLTICFLIMNESENKIRFASIGNEF